MIKPVFSIITVTYNAAPLLERTIKSVLGQSEAGKVEYLIIDGGSTDGTADIIKRYESGLAYWASEPDEGLYYAMNKGLQQATGDYVWFMNAGDVIHASCVVEKLTEIVKTESPDVIYGETNIVDKEGNFVSERRLKAPAILTWKSFKMGMLVCHQSFLVKRTIAPLYNVMYRFSADFDWCIRSMKKAAMISNANMILSDYLEEGLTTSNRKASLKERFEIMKRNYGVVIVISLHVWFTLRYLWAKWITGNV